MSEKLAILGGRKSIDFTFSRYNTIGSEEKRGVIDVIDSGVLSDFVGAPGESFLGGKYVKQFETKFAKQFKTDHAISVNSWTSGLITAIGALGIEPGDEVLVTPWTMCASAAAILHWNAIPVFVDIEDDMFCMDPSKIEEKITDRTKAILVVDIFGQSADMDPISSIADKYSLSVISDCAQAPGALYKDRFAGTMGDIGGFSFNYHKHIHTGEGGMIVTNSEHLARRSQLIRNHAEAVVENGDKENLSNMIGFNFRLGELESCIGLSQLDKLQAAIISRQKAAMKLDEGLADLKGLDTPKIRDKCSHVYYFYGMKHNESETGVTKAKVYEALIAEGVPYLSMHYQNLHLLPMFQQKICYGTKNYPWTINNDREYDYGRGLCPVAESLNQSSFLGLFMCGSQYIDDEIDALIQAFRKVYTNIEKLM